MKTGNNHDPEKLLELFKKSKKVVSTFADQFQKKHGRKPHGEDLASAPEYVRVCIKNCKRIKAHLEKDPQEVQTSPQEEKQPSKLQKSTSEVSKENLSATKSKSKVWGAHLNRSFSDITNNATDKRRRRAAEIKTVSYSGTLSALVLEDLSKSTRKSLAKRRTICGKKSFFDTMGDESTLQNLIDNAEVTQDTIEDPLMRFHPELSMDGLSQHGQPKAEVIDDEDCEIGQVGGTQPLKTANQNQSKLETKSMSVLTSVTVKNVKATERAFDTREEIPLSFSGLFPKNDSGVKRKMEEDLGESSEKRQKMSEDFQEEEDMFADDDDFFDDENVDSNNVEDALIPLDQVEEEEKESSNKNTNRRKAKNPKKLNGLVSNNFVKIDLKKKNYVRGSKNMTGSKYKRQEWKRKVQGKFGKRN